MRWLLLGLTVLIFVWVVVLVASSLSSYAQLQGYQAGQCTIIAKQLLQEETADSTGSSLSYKPYFQFLVQTTDSRQYRANGYEYPGALFADPVQSRVQAVVDGYRVQETYPCWYDLAHPTQAVLTRQFDWWGHLAAPVFVGIFIVIPLSLAVWGMFLSESGIPQTYTVWGYTYGQRDRRPDGY